ncbi:hypothetical protein [Devosia sp.]|uniref:hypothetical protein n=1 Tax=Devosia sp. TaxID=1871048 RepID=UPI0025FCF5FD|nr:hypothetical protein [Devosia sp.]MCR6633486.1 hypothetical protein [Devosia sp.]
MTGTTKKLAPVDERSMDVSLWHLLMLARSAQANVGRQTIEASSTVIARDLNIARERPPKALLALEGFFGSDIQTARASKHDVDPTKRARRSGVLSKKGKSIGRGGSRSRILD